MAHWKRRRRPVAAEVLSVLGEERDRNLGTPSCFGKIGVEGLPVGGFVTNPFETYTRQNGNIPQVGLKRKNIWNDHLVFIRWYDSFLNVLIVILEMLRLPLKDPESNSK